MVITEIKMKKIIYVLLVAMFIAACSKSEDSTFLTDISEDVFSFKPIAGGAIMHYNLPADPEIMGICVRYKDAFGSDMLRSASSICDSIILIGFNEAQSNVPAVVTLCRRDGVESNPINITFGTKDSGPVAFMNNVQVKSGWNGFTVTYNNPENSKGMAHVFYLGINPRTNEPDTILISSFNLEEGEDFIVYQPKQESGKYDIVIRAEDFRGHMVKERVWENIDAITTSKLDASEFEFVCDNIVTSEKDKIGLQYLFDGDTKGTTWWDEEEFDRFHFYSFLAGPNAAGENAHPMYVDMKKNRLTAQLRIYCMLGYMSGKGPDFSAPVYSKAEPAGIWYGYYENMLPCKVTVYGCKDDGNSDWESKAWEKIGNFEEAPKLAQSLRWTRNAAGSMYNYVRLANKVAMEECDPSYLAIDFDAEQGEGYRYLKIVIDDVFDLPWNPSDINQRNGLEYVAMQELEIYTD